MTRESVMKSNIYKLFMLFNIIVPLAVGVSLYYYFRPDTYISQFLYGVLRLPQSNSRVLDNGFVIFINSYLQDFLWAYALTFAISFIVGQSKIKNALVLAICVLFEIFTELMQKVGVISGVFDLWDIILMALATSLALLLIIIKTKRR